MRSYLPGKGILLAIIYWLVIAISLLYGAAMIVLPFGLAGSPELQEQIREAIRATSATAEP